MHLTLHLSVWERYGNSENNWLLTRRQQVLCVSLSDSTLMNVGKKKCRRGTPNGAADSARARRQRRPIGE